MVVGVEKPAMLARKIFGKKRLPEDRKRGEQKAGQDQHSRRPFFEV
jgi:hypothetical protein